MTFREIVGHSRVKALLSGAIARGTIPPTLLFAGPHGVGKSRVAEATASAINCLSPVRSAEGKALDGCGVCRSCDRIGRGVHVDVVRLEQFPWLLEDYLQMKRTPDDPSPAEARRLMRKIEEAKGL